MSNEISCYSALSTPARTECLTTWLAVKLARSEMLCVNSWISVTQKVINQCNSWQKLPLQVRSRPHHCTIPASNWSWDRPAGHWCPQLPGVLGLPLGTLVLLLLWWRSYVVHMFFGDCIRSCDCGIDSSFNVVTWAAYSYFWQMNEQ